MAEGRGPAVFTIPVYRSFADALATGIIAKFAGDRLAMARGMVLVPNNRAVRSITDAFVRRAEGGMLLPRIVAIGDAGEAPATAIDDIGSAIPPAVDPLTRQMILARLVQQERALAGDQTGAAEAMRLATELGGTLDELIAEDRRPEDLRSLEVAGDLAIHWQNSIALFTSVIERWPEELARLGKVDLPERRNLLLRALAKRWRTGAAPSFVVAAGITTAAPAVAELLGVIARMPNGMLVLPGLDLASPDEEWEAIAGMGGGSAIETHPQHHLWLLLDRIGVARAEVSRWRWGDGRPRKAVRGRVVSNAFAPAQFTSKWVGLRPHLLALPGVRLAEFASAADEAQGIAIALREALETPERTAALVTPDRVLGGRVAAHLRRWGIEADDSAGQPLAATPVGVLIQALGQLGVEHFAPAALLAVLKHPLVRVGDTRLSWLDGARTLDLALRGPRPAPGIDGLMAWLAAGKERERRVRLPALEWWREQAALFRPLEEAFGREGATLADLLAALSATLTALAGDAAWAGAEGRAAADLLADLEARATLGPLSFSVADLMPMLRQLLGDIAIRPPQGGHPRIAIWGLLEARLQQADLLVMGGLNEGNWPAATVADPWLSPRVRRELGLADPERRVGLSAHDLATGLGAREVLLTRAARDARSQTLASRFLLRLDAMTGGVARDNTLPALAHAIDANAGSARPAERPAPSPPAADRPRRISVTEVDRLKADPFAFYARSMLKLSPLDAVDAEPGPAWRGTAVHAVLQSWMEEDGLSPDTLVPRVQALLAEAGTHPLLRTLWQPRLIAAVEWVAAEIVARRAEGREPLIAEKGNSITVAGIELKGVVDRLDRLPDGRLAVVDYKTGTPPSGKAVAAGFSMQLGLLAAIAERAGFGGHQGPVAAFEYWSLARNANQGFGAIRSPVGKTGQIAKEDFVDRALSIFAEAAARWLTGSEPFVAKLAPDFAPFEDYDQLMRRDEWYGRED